MSMADGKKPLSMLIFLPSALLSKEQRMKYDYHFNNETISIDIPDSDYDVLIEMDRLERNLEKKETRRHISMDSGKVDEKQLLSDADVESVCIRLFEDETLRCAMNRLLPAQRELIQKVFFENQSIVSIAREQGVGESAIRDRLGRVYARLKIFLE
jgi:hypothetical protein